MTKYLGKIETASFGCDEIGEGEIGWTVRARFPDGPGYTDFTSAVFLPRLSQVDDLLTDAKVSEIGELVGLSVEVEMDAMTMTPKSWRVLTEVL